MYVTIGGKMKKNTTEKVNAMQKKETPKALSGKDIRFQLVKQFEGKTISTLPEYSMMLQACEKALTTDGQKIGTGKALTAIKKGLYKGKAQIVYDEKASKETTQGSRVKFLSPTKDIDWNTLELSRC